MYVPAVGEHAVFIQRINCTITRENTAGNGGVSVPGRIVIGGDDGEGGKGGGSGLAE